MIKQTATLGLAAAIAIAAFSGPADAGKKGRNVAIGIIAGITAATVLTAAANAAQRRYQYDDYAYADDYSPSDNALAACVHKAYRTTRRDGGDGIDLVAVERNSFKEGFYRVRVVVNAYGPWGTARRGAVCKIDRDRIVEWKWYRV
ncbi:MAG: hypothetical protein AB7S41_14110 [Parvibaculaceae bacterium]